MTPSSISWVWPKRPDGWRSERNRWARPPGPTRPACSCWRRTPPPIRCGGRPLRRGRGRPVAPNALHQGGAGGAAGTQLLRHARGDRHLGFAAALAEKLAARDEERYGPAAQQLRAKADRALMRQREKRQHEKNMRQGKHKPWAAPPSRPSKREEAPPTTSRRERGKGGSGRRPGRPETGTGRAPRTFPGKPGPGRAEADCEAQIRRQEPCRETLRNEVALYDEQIPCPRGGQGLQAEFQGHRGDHDQIQPDPQEPHAGPGGAGAGRYFRLSDPAQPGGEHRVHFCGRLP